MAEQAVLVVGNQVCVLRDALHHILGVEFNAQHPVIAWMVTHAGDIITKFRVGKDGKRVMNEHEGINTIGNWWSLGKGCSTEVVSSTSPTSWSHDGKQESS